MREKTIKVYEYEELSDKAKERALSEWEHERDIPFLTEQIQTHAEELISEYGFTDIDIQPLYSLSYSQGDGVCIVGQMRRGGWIYTIKHNGHYNHENSKTLHIEKYTTGEDASGPHYEQFNTLYVAWCKACEKLGYAIIEYETSEENFRELCAINEWTFRENGEWEDL